jgi:hypothetical protein
MFGQVIKVGAPLPDASEDRVVWTNSLRIHKIRRKGTVNYETEFAYPSRGNNPFDELVRKCVVDAVAKLTR